MLGISRTDQVDNQKAMCIMAVAMFCGAGPPRIRREAENAAATTQRPFAGRNPECLPGNSGKLVVELSRSV
jgi:hypothetical protein